MNRDYYLSRMCGLGHVIQNINVMV